MFQLRTREEKVFHYLAEGVIEKYDVIIENQLVGEAIVVNNGSDQLYLDGFSIAPEYQGKGYGTQAVRAFFTDFPYPVQTIYGMALEPVMDGFWSKQEGFIYAGEGHDETEGYLYFTLKP